MCMPICHVVNRPIHINYINNIKSSSTVACPPYSSSGRASLSSATSLGAWSAVATFPKIRVKTSSGSDFFYDESFSDETNP